jgi:hypothetical protein
MYKIEFLLWGNWVDDIDASIGHPNKFTEESDAENEIPKLSQSLECEQSHLRIVEI